MEPEPDGFGSDHNVPVPDPTGFGSATLIVGAGAVLADAVFVVTVCYGVRCICCVCRCCVNC